MIVQDLSIRADWQSLTTGGRPANAGHFKMFAGAQGLLRVTVANAAGAMELPGVIRFGVRAILPNVLPGEAALSDLLVLSAGSEKLNVDGDWADADLDDGKFSMRYSSNTDAMRALFETYGMREMPGLFEIQAEEDGLAYPLAQWRGPLLLDVVWPDSQEPVDPQVYATVEALAAISYDLVSQAEAEAGTATTRRIWSALRVAQAIAARAPVKSVAGKTGVVTLAKSDVGMGQVDNTSDADKPVSTAQAAALDFRANPLAPVPFTGADARAAADVVTFATADANGTWFRNASNPISVTDGSDGNFNMWPFSPVHDPIKDQLFCFYSSGTHRDETGANSMALTAKVRRLDNASRIDPNSLSKPFNAPVTIHTESGLYTTVFAAFQILAGRNAGRLVAMISTQDGVAFTPSSKRYSYSDDAAATWITETLLDDAGSPILCSFIVSAKAWSDGRVMMITNDHDAALPQDTVYRFYESIDGRNSWKLINTLNAYQDDLLDTQAAAAGLTLMVPWEPSWVEVGYGQALFVWRSHINQSGPEGRIVTNSCSAFGRAMTPFRMTSIRADNNPAALTYDARTDQLEMLIGSRETISGGAGGLYIARSNLANAMEGTWNARAKVLTAAYDSDGKRSWAFYPSVRDVSPFKRIALYYDMNPSDNTTTEIFMLVGTNEAARTGRARPDKALYPSADVALGSFGDGYFAGWQAKDIMGTGADADRILESTGEQRFLHVSGDADAPTYNPSGYFTFPSTSIFTRLATRSALANYPAGHITLPAGRKDFVGFGIVLRATSTASAVRRVLGLYNHSNGAFVCSLRTGSDNKIGAFWVADSGGASADVATVNQATALATGAWMAIGVGYNTATGTLQLVINDVSIGTAPTTATGTGTVPDTMRLVIGADNISGGTHRPSQAMDVHSAFVVTTASAFAAMNTTLTAVAGSL